jgi:hypothetical protein
MSPRGKPRKDRGPKRKAVKIRLCERMHAGKIVEAYRIMEAIIATDRKDLAHLKIGIAWHTGWRQDADGVKTHGKCLKRSDLDRSLDGYDAMIVLNEKSWLAFGEEDKLRLITHELEHIQIASDKNGEPLIDDKGRQVIRLRRHDVADFACIIARFGLPPCLSDVQIHDADRPLLQFAEAKDRVTAETNLPAGPGEPGQAKKDAWRTSFGEQIALKFKGLRGCKCIITVRQEIPGGLWRAAYSAELGNITASEVIQTAPPVADRALAIRSAMRAAIVWLEGIAITGRADFKRAFAARRDQMKEQIEEQIEKLAGPQPESFTEDEPDTDADENEE